MQIEAFFSPPHRLVQYSWAFRGEHSRVVANRPKRKRSKCIFRICVKRIRNVWCFAETPFEKITFCPRKFYCLIFWEELIFSNIAHASFEFCTHFLRLWISGNENCKNKYKKNRIENNFLTHQKEANNKIDNLETKKQDIAFSDAKSKNSEFSFRWFRSPRDAPGSGKCVSLWGERNFVNGTS